MSTVFTHSPMVGDTWDMQGALLYFGTVGDDGKVTATGTAPTSTLTAYPKSGDTTNLPIVAVGISLSLQRQVAKRYPINVRRVIYMVGQPEGQMQINCLFGPDITMQNFLSKFNAIGNNQGQGAVASNKTAIYIVPFGKMYTSNTESQNLGLGTWCVTDPVINGIGLQITESGQQQVPAVANVSFTFTSLDIS